MSFSFDLVVTFQMTSLPPCRHANLSRQLFTDTIINILGFRTNIKRRNKLFRSFEARKTVSSFMIWWNLGSTINSSQLLSALPLLRGEIEIKRSNKNFYKIKYQYRIIDYRSVFNGFQTRIRVFKGAAKHFLVFQF